MSEIHIHFSCSLLVEHFFFYKEEISTLVKEDYVVLKYMILYVHKYDKGLVRGHWSLQRNHLNTTSWSLLLQWFFIVTSAQSVSYSTTFKENGEMLESVPLFTSLCESAKRSWTFVPAHERIQQNIEGPYWFSYKEKKILN